MNIKQWALSATVLGLLINTPVWADEVVHESGMGALSIGYGALSAISSPLVIASGAVTGDTNMAAKGGLMAAATPSMVLGATGNFMLAASKEGVETGKAIVHLVNASGEKLTELNEQVFDALNLGPSVGNVPTVQAKINHQTKLVPLVVRQQYVQMNEPDK